MRLRLLFLLDDAVFGRVCPPSPPNMDMPIRSTTGTPNKHPSRANPSHTNKTGNASSIFLLPKKPWSRPAVSAAA